MSVVASQFDPSIDLLADSGMHDRVEVAQRLGIGEDDLRQLGTPQRTVIVEHLLAESLGDRLDDRRAWLLHLAGDACRRR